MVRIFPLFIQKVAGAVISRRLRFLEERQEGETWYLSC